MSAIVDDKIDTTSIEQEIENQQRNVSYDTKEYTIEIIVNKYKEKLDSDENEFFVPEYQREFVWDEKRQSRFIESLMIGLPIPYIFLAETKSGRYEIVDGSQRIRTLAAYLNDELILKGLDKIPSLNTLCFSKLDLSRQRKFKNISMKMIVLSERTTDETKSDIFERINRGSDLLKNMEYRKGVYQGLFNDFLSELAKNELFMQLTPIAKWLENRQEREELLLRFFAFSKKYPKFSDSDGIAKQLDEYMKEQNDIFAHDDGADAKKIMQDEFNMTMQFVKEYYPHGFTKHKNLTQVARPYFEALAVGTNLALRENKNLSVNKTQVEKLLEDDTFIKSVSGRYQTHKAKSIKARIDYVKDGLLKNAK